MTKSQMFVKLEDCNCLRSQNCGHRVPRQEKHMTKPSLESQNSRFYDHFAETKPSDGMMGFSLLKSILCIRLEALPCFADNEIIRLRYMFMACHSSHFAICIYLKCHFFHLSFSNALLNFVFLSQSENILSDFFSQP